MGYVNITQHMEATPEVVFDFAADTRRLPLWLTLFTHVDVVGERLDHVGAKYDAVVKLGGQQIESTWEVTKVDPPRLLRLNGTAPDGGVATAWLTFGAWEGGCEMQFEIDYELPGGVVSGIADKLFVERSIARDLKHSLHNLQLIVEHHRDVQPPT